MQNIEPATGMPIANALVFLQMSQEQGCNCPCNEQTAYPGYAPLALPALPPTPEAFAAMYPGGFGFQWTIWVDLMIWHDSIRMIVSNEKFILNRDEPWILFSVLVFWLEFEPFWKRNDMPSTHQTSPSHFILFHACKFILEKCKSVKLFGFERTLGYVAIFVNR